MHAWARAAVTSAVSIWGAVIIVGAVSIYGLSQYELAWGRGASLQVYLWIATGTSFVACFGAGIGFRAGSQRGSVPGMPGSIATGILALALSAAALALVTYPADVSLLYVGATFFLVPAVVAYVACILAKRSAARAV